MNELLVCRRVSATAKIENDPVSGLITDVAATLSTPVSCDAPFVGLSFT
jgi:hypothetical protein